MGIYFVEAGANQRPSRVIYDRDGSAISLTVSNAYNWPKVLNGVTGLHLSGITPSLSQQAADATVLAAKTAQSMGVSVSCDLNYRAKLWNWESGTSRRDLAGRVMRDILPYVDVLIANEADCGDVLNIHAGDSDVDSGNVQVDKYPDVARQVVQQFPNIQTVATTLRESHSASHNNWGAMLFDASTDTALFAPVVDGRYEPYQIRNIVDRVGGGDAFAAGLLFAMHSGDYPELQQVLSFATAASCLAHSISGDFNFSSRSEVEALMGGSASGRVVR
jgi:2-dehydro-3-deoxygluconokinase